MATNLVVNNGLSVLKHCRNHSYSYFKRHLKIQSLEAFSTVSGTKSNTVISSCCTGQDYVTKRHIQNLSTCIKLSQNSYFKFDRCFPVNSRLAGNVSSKLYTTSSDKDNPEQKDEKNLTIFQRFKKAYKEHGKVLIGVHLVTSTVWFGSFYYLAVSGIDVVSLLESWGLSETILKPFKSSHLGEVAVAYLLYKLATPARYTVTLGGTNFTIKYLQKKGKMPKATERERLKDLVKDGREELRDKRKEIDSKIKERSKKKKAQDQS